MSKIVLASQSPRRSKLLAEMGVTFNVITSNFDEHLDETRDAEVVAKELAYGKAADVAKENHETYVIGSDTIVAVNGRQMEKPVDIEEAREMLIALAGHESTVSTGVAIINYAKKVSMIDVDTTRVYFKPNSEKVTLLREEYLATEDWKDKAGAYGIQSGAAPLIEKIEGDYDTVIGLPTLLLAEMLNKLGIEARAVVEPAPVPQIDSYS